MLRIYYKSEGNDAVAKKKNKIIAEAAKNTIKENGFVEVWSKKTNQLEAKIKNSETILPGWGGIDFELDDEIDPMLAEKGCLVQGIEMIKIEDVKHPGQTIDCIYRIII